MLCMLCVFVAYALYHRGMHVEDVAKINTP